MRIDHEAIWQPARQLALRRSRFRHSCWRARGYARLASGNAQLGDRLGDSRCGWGMVVDLAASEPVLRKLDVLNALAIA